MPRSPKWLERGHDQNQMHWNIHPSCVPKYGAFAFEATGQKGTAKPQAQCESLRFKLIGGLAVRRACYGVLRRVLPPADYADGSLRKRRGSKALGDQKVVGRCGRLRWF